MISFLLSSLLLNQVSSYIKIQDGLYRTWAAAEAKCVERGTHLVTINSDEELLHVVQEHCSYISTGFELTCWLGYNFNDILDKWEWVGDTTESYGSWSESTANGYYPTKCATIKYNINTPVSCTYRMPIILCDDLPTPSPTNNPTPLPTVSPTPTPTNSPTSSPTPLPTASPTPEPTNTPTSSPTESPTSAPTTNPTLSPTSNPTNVPTLSPTPEPTNNPTPAPTKEIISPEDPDEPTYQPTLSPTNVPTLSPTNNPTPAPTSESRDVISPDKPVTTIAQKKESSEVKYIPYIIGGVGCILALIVVIFCAVCCCKRQQIIIIDHSNIDIQEPEGQAEIDLEGQVAINITYQ